MSLPGCDYHQAYQVRAGAIELPLDLGQRIHQNRLLQLARESAATTIQHLARFDDERRYGSLVAILLETTATAEVRLRCLNLP